MVDILPAVNTTGIPTSRTAEAERTLGGVKPHTLFLRGMLGVVVDVRFLTQLFQFEF
jgi:hypothetical protein